SLRAKARSSEDESPTILTASSLAIAVDGRELIRAAQKLRRGHRPAGAGLDSEVAESGEPGALGLESEIAELVGETSPEETGLPFELVSDVGGSSSSSVASSLS